MFPWLALFFQILRVLFSLQIARTDLQGGNLLTLQ